MSDGVKKKTARRKKASKANGEAKELRLTELEMAEMTITERDHQLSLKDIELASAKLMNLTMEFQRKQSLLKQMVVDAQRKSEQAAKIKNGKMAEVDQRLRTIDPEFSFSTYIIKDDGTLVPEGEIIGSKESDAEALPSV